MAKAKKGAPVEGATASFNPDEMVQAGLADDFDGELVKARYTVWNYNGNIDHYVLGVAVTIQPDEESGLEEFTQMYSAGDLKNWVPSEDGVEPAGAEVDEYLALGAGEGEPEDDDTEALSGPFAIKVGKQSGLPNSSNWAFFVRSLGAAGFSDWSNDLRSMEGTYGHWNRIAPPTRSGLQTDSGRKASDVLVLTELMDNPNAGSKKKTAKAKTAKAKAKAKEAEEEAEDADAEEGGEDEEDEMSVRVRETVVEALGEAKDNTLTRQKMVAAVKSNFKGKELAAAFRIAKEEEFLSGNEDYWVYDEEDGTLTLLAE